MDKPRYIFTVTAGRSGQASLTDLVRRHVPGSLALFEEPNIRTSLPRVLGDLERRFRRRFVETHELLGRGRVLPAFDAGDDAALDRMAAARLAWIDRRIDAAGAEIYVDISKHFARGLHRAIARACPGMGLIRLVRDPILNMRSFLNRNKNFYLDNNRPDGRNNMIRLDPDALSAGELYLWAWAEQYLRFDALVEEYALSPVAEIRTEDLTDAERMTRHFASLGLNHGALETAPPRNTNAELGFGHTAVTPGDIETFERFLVRLPAAVVRRIEYFDDYDPRARHGNGQAA